MKTPKPEYRIENWSMGNPYRQDPYKAPELYKMHLMGNIQGHPTCTPGKDHVTSEVKSIDLKNRRVETRNSIYTLGRIDKKYYDHAVKLSKQPETLNILQTIYLPEIGN